MTIFLVILVWTISIFGALYFRKVYAWLITPKLPLRQPLSKPELFKLELESGLGIDWTREWFIEQPLKVVNSFSESLAVKEFNGAVDVYCYGCGSRYVPHQEHDDFYKNKKFNIYGGLGISTSNDENILREYQKLCRFCLALYKQDPWVDYTLSSPFEPSIFTKEIV